MPDDDPIISRRQMLRAKVLGGMLDGAARGLGQAYGVMNHLKQAAAEDPPPPPMPPMPVLHRPPGACDEIAFTAQCTQCDACVRACPVDAVIRAPGMFAKAAGTPMIDPKTNPCTMCDGLDTPDGFDHACIVACQTDGSGVLDNRLSKRMGTAKVLKPSCLAFAGEECRACVDVCPVDGAIEMLAAGPRVVPGVCTGCGVCQHACPTTPRAIAIVPVRDRAPLPVISDD